MSKSTNTYVLGLIKAVPKLTRLYDEHVSDYDELFPHVFFGDLTRYILDLYKCIVNYPSDKRRWTELDAILAYLEHGMAGDDEEVQELIAVSFLENLDLTDSSLRNLEERFGLNLKNELKVIRGG